jgi:hypothetical protein
MSKGERDEIMSPSDVQTLVIATSSILYAQNPRGNLPILWGFHPIYVA